MSSRGQTTRPRRSGLLGQAVLILLPVVVLTVVGLLSLRRDRALAGEEARERAGRIAQEIVDRTIIALFEVEMDPGLESTAVVPGVDLHRPGFEITPQLALVWPKPLEETPTPQWFDAAALPPAVREAWTVAEQASLAGDWPAAAAEWDRVLEAGPPAQFAANALFELARAELVAGRKNQALAHYSEVASNYPAVLGQTGLPLAPLALWRATELELDSGTNADHQAAILQAACSNLVLNPTALTPLLLRRLEERPGTPSPRDNTPSTNRTADIRDLHASDGRDLLIAWRQLWETTRLARALFIAARSEWEREGQITTQLARDSERLLLPPVSPIWVEMDSHAGTRPAQPECSRGLWLLTPIPPSTLKFRAWTACEVTNVLRQVLGQLPDVPSYFAGTVTIAGRTLPAPPAGALLAERAERHAAQPGGRQPRLTASVYLVNPAALYARQRQRSLWFAAVVLAAAGTAGIGLVSVHRAFARQVRLGEMKSNFVSSVSHELRAPIASVRLLAESLDRGTITDEAKRRDYFRLISQECRRLSTLIENVLDFSRIDLGRKQYEFEPTDMAALVRQTLDLMKPYAAEREVVLDLRLPQPDDLPLADHPLLDGKAIQQALVNLIDNAVKHSPAGASVEVALSVETDGRGDGPQCAAKVQSVGVAVPPTPAPPPVEHPARLALSVTDHGPGIPPAEHERIFEPFYRLGSELRRETTGVGIGLSIVKHIVEAHDGRVRVTSTVGQGSRFVIELPLTGPSTSSTP